MRCQPAKWSEAVVEGHEYHVHGSSLVAGRQVIRVVAAAKYVAAAMYPYEHWQTGRCRDVGSPHCKAVLFIDSRNKYRALLTVQKKAVLVSASNVQGSRVLRTGCAKFLRRKRPVPAAWLRWCCPAPLAHRRCCIANPFEHSNCVFHSAFHRPALKHCSRIGRAASARGQQ